VLLEHPPVITLGRRAEEGELHVPDGAEVEIVETDRGGKSTYHGPGQLVCYPILDLRRHGQDVKRYCRDLEEALIQTLAPLGVEATRIEGLTGIWVDGPPRKIASIGIHVSRWVTTHGYALNVDLDPAPFTDWITACGLEDASFTTIARELGRQVGVDEVAPHGGCGAGGGLRARARGAAGGGEPAALAAAGPCADSRHALALSARFAHPPRLIVAAAQLGAKGCGREVTPLAHFGRGRSGHDRGQSPAMALQSGRPGRFGLHTRPR